MDENVILPNEAEMINASVNAPKSRIYAARKLSKFFEIEIKLRVFGQEICSWCYPPINQQSNSNNNEEM